jgi:uncharacterized protein (TIGR03083 family)
MSQDTNALKPILTAHLFRKLEGMLAELLCGLDSNDWERPTLSPRWKVKDVAAHLLDTQLRRLTICRDGYTPDAAIISSQSELVTLVNRLNREGVNVYRRLSPNMLISLMETVSAQTCEYFESLDPLAPAPWGVSWAGEEKSLNWFDTAREFTERWHHQQQIRLAVGKPGLMTRELYHPVLDCFMRALPFHYQVISRDRGSLARFTISGECGGDWYLHRGESSWELLASAIAQPLAETTIPQEIAWQIFTKGIDQESGKRQVQVRGDRELSLHVLTMICIVG